MKIHYQNRWWPNSPGPLMDDWKVTDDSSVNFHDVFFFIFCQIIAKNEEKHVMEIYGWVVHNFPVIRKWTRGIRPKTLSPPPLSTPLLPLPLPPQPPPCEETELLLCLLGCAASWFSWSSLVISSMALFPRQMRFCLVGAILSWLLWLHNLEIWKLIFKHDDY